MSDQIHFKGIPFEWGQPGSRSAKPDDASIILVAPWVAREWRRIHREAEKLIRLKRELRLLRKRPCRS